MLWTLMTYTWKVVTLPVTIIDGYMTVTEKVEDYIADNRRARRQAETEEILKKSREHRQRVREKWLTPRDDETQ